MYTMELVPLSYCAAAAVPHQPATGGAAAVVVQDSRRSCVGFCQRRGPGCLHGANAGHVREGGVSKVGRVVAEATFPLVAFGLDTKASRSAVGAFIVATAAFFYQ